MKSLMWRRTHWTNEEEQTQNIDISIKTTWSERLQVSSLSRKEIHWYSFMKCSSTVVLVHGSESDTSLRFPLVYLNNTAVDLYVCHFLSCSVALLRHWTFTIIGLASLWFSTVYTQRQVRLYLKLKMAAGPPWREQNLQDTVVWDEVDYCYPTLLSDAFYLKRKVIKSEQVLKKNMTIFGFELTS